MDDTKSSLQRLRNGDASGLNYLLTRYRKRLLLWIRYRLDRSLTRRLDPEDILQDVYLTALEKFSSLDCNDGEGFFQWILSMVENRMRDVRKHHLSSAKRTVRKEKYVEPDELGESDPGRPDQRPLSASPKTPSGILELENQLREFQEVITELPQLQRDAIMLVRIGGLAVAEAAKVLGLPPQSIYLGLVRGFMNIRKIIRRKKEQWPYLAEKDPKGGKDDAGLYL